MRSKASSALAGGARSAQYSSEADHCERGQQRAT